MTLNLWHRDFFEVNGNKGDDTISVDGVTRFQHLWRWR